MSTHLCQQNLLGEHSDKFLLNSINMPLKKATSCTITIHPFTLYSLILSQGHEGTITALQ